MVRRSAGFFAAGLIVGFAVICTFAQEKLEPVKVKPKAAAGELKTLKEKASYAFGMQIGKDLASEGADLDAELIARGIKDALASKTLLSPDEFKEVMNAFAKEVRAKAEAKAKEVGEKNKKEGDAFLAANKKSKDVQTTATGLQYKVIRAGKGESPKKTSKVKVHYHGTLIDGTVFDSSVERKEPIDFGVDQVIPGWTEALLKMKVGDKWKIFIPSDLAYGPQGTGPGGPIGPNAVLVFDVELLEIVE